MIKTLHFDYFDNFKHKLKEMLNEQNKVQVLAITSNNKYVVVNVSMYKNEPELKCSGTLFDSIKEIAIL